MKKIIALLLALVLVLSLAACGSKKEEAPETEAPEVEAPVEEETPAEEEEAPVEEESPVEEETPEVEAPVEEETPEVEAPAEEEVPEIETMPEEKLNEMTALMEQIIAGVNSEMATMTMELTSDMYEFYGVPAIEGANVVISAAMMNAVAHEVILVELPEGTDMEAAKADMESLQDPMKWLCVQPEANFVLAGGNYLLGVMSFQADADTIAANFDAVIGG